MRHRQTFAILVAAAALFAAPAAAQYTPPSDSPGPPPPLDESPAVLSEWQTAAITYVNAGFRRAEQLTDCNQVPLATGKLAAYYESYREMFPAPLVSSWRERAQQMTDLCDRVARETSGRRGSLFDLGIYAGGAWSDGWLEDSGIGFSGQQQEGFAAQAREEIGTVFQAYLEAHDPRPGTPSFWAGTRYYRTHSEGRFSSGPTTQTQFGGVYTAPSPSGTSGVQLQLFGIEAQHDVRLETFSLEGGIGLLDWQPATGETSHSGTLYITVWYERRERDEVATLFSPSPAGSTSFFFDQTRQQELDDNLFGANLLLRDRISLAPRLRLDLTGAAGAYLRDSDFSSFEHVESNVVPVPDRDFDLTLTDTDSGAGVRGELGAALLFEFSPRISLMLGGRAGYSSSLGAIFNPRSSVELLTEGRTAGIVRSDAWTWDVGGGVVIHFGPPGSN